MYCPKCGAANADQASFCQRCGANLKPEGATATPTTPGSPNAVSAGAQTQGGKSKTASILLAVFLGFWTWLYTYKKDAWKFWVGLGLGILDIVLIIATFGLSIFFTWIISFGIWVWAIVDVCVKDSKWYSSY
jgi:hypothetical protein